MKPIIVGRYNQQREAEYASRELLRAGFPLSEMSLFYVNPEGQHAIYPVGGDEDESPGTHDAKSGAMRGAAGGVGAGALVGVATIPVLGPAGPLLGAAVVVCGDALSLPATPVAVAGAVAGFALRFMAMRYGWQLPVARART